MPIYEYKCRKCEGEFSWLTLGPAQENPNIVCTHCGSQDLELLPSPPGLLEIK